MEEKKDLIKKKNNKKIYFVISILILIILMFLLINSIVKDRLKYTPDESKLKNDLVTDYNILLENTTTNENTDYQKTIKYNWQVNIPKLDNLVCPVNNGTTSSVLRTYVGHLEGTGINKNNICLAGHTNTANYKGVFYFNDLNKLEIGDVVYYKYYTYEQKFVVSEIKEVNETDLSVLDKTDDTRLTLITCITGKHEKRLVVVCDTEENFLKNHSKEEINE